MAGLYNLHAALKEALPMGPLVKLAALRVRKRGADPLDGLSCNLVWALADRR